MRLADLGQVSARLAEPHVARWFLSGSTVEDELDDLRRAITGEEPTHELVVQADGRDIGWCQWYRCADYPAHAEATQAPPPTTPASTTQSVIRLASDMGSERH